MKYFLRNNGVDFVHKHGGYRKSLITVQACFKDCGRMRSNVGIQDRPENYDDAAKELYKIIFDKYPETEFEKIVPARQKKK